MHYEGSAPEGCVAKTSGIKQPKFTGPARVFNSEQACLKAILANKIKAGEVIVIRYESTVGQSGDSSDAVRLWRRVHAMVAQAQQLLHTGTQPRCGPRQNQRAAELKAWMPEDLRPVRTPAAIVHV
jgi:hypothetical protein